MTTCGASATTGSGAEDGLADGCVVARVGIEAAGSRGGVAVS